MPGFGDAALLREIDVAKGFRNGGAVAEGEVGGGDVGGGGQEGFLADIMVLASEKAHHIGSYEAKQLSVMVFLCCSR